MVWTWPVNWSAPGTSKPRLRETNVAVWVARANAERLARVAVEARGQIDRQDRTPVVDMVNHGRRRLADRSLCGSPAGRRQSTERLQVGRPGVELGRRVVLEHRCIGRPQNVEIGSRVPSSFCESANSSTRTSNPRFSRCRAMTNPSPPLFPAREDGNAPVYPQAFEQLGRTAAGVLHQHDTGHAQLALARRSTSRTSARLSGRNETFMQCCTQQERTGGRRRGKRAGGRGRGPKKSVTSRRLVGTAQHGSPVRNLSFSTLSPLPPALFPHHRPRPSPLHLLPFGVVPASNGEGRRVLDQYADRWALITGTSSGIGAEFARRWRPSACIW